MLKKTRKKVFVVYMFIDGNDTEVFSAKTLNECKVFAENYQKKQPNAVLQVSPSPVFI